MSSSMSKPFIPNCVVEYDMSNPRSWQGPPTTNHLVTSTWGQANCQGRADRRPFASTSHSGFSQAIRGQTFTLIPGSSITTPETPVAENTVWNVRDSDPNNFSRFSPHSGFDIDELPTLNIPYVVSVYIYIPPNVTLGDGNDLSVQQNDTGADWHGGPTGGVATYNSTWNYWAANITNQGVPANTSLRGEWQRMYISFTPSSSIRNQQAGVNIDKLGGYFRPNLVGQSNANYFFVSSAQMEPGLYPSPYVHGTRSATQSILDLVSNRTMTVSNLVYNQNGSFSFNGTSTEISFSTSGLNFATEQTIVMIIKPTDNDQLRRNPYNHEYAGYGTITHEINGELNYYHGTSGGNGVTYQGTGSGFTVLPNETAMIVVSRGATTVKWYKNGQFIRSDANSYPTAVTTVSTAYIGTGYTSRFQGDIPYFAMYDRQLTDTEVAQIYGGLRGRYGI